MLCHLFWLSTSLSSPWPNSPLLLQGSLSRALGLRLRDEMSSSAAQTSTADMSPTTPSSSSTLTPSYYYPRRPDSRGMRQSPSVSSSERSGRQSVASDRNSSSSTSFRPPPPSMGSASRTHGPNPRGYGPSPPPGCLQNRPRSSVMPQAHENPIDTHRRVRSIGDIEHVTVTPV